MKVRRQLHLETVSGSASSFLAMLWISFGRGAKRVAKKLRNPTPQIFFPFLSDFDCLRSKQSESQRERISGSLQWNSPSLFGPRWVGGHFSPLLQVREMGRGRARFKTPKARQEDRNKVRIETEQGEVTLTGDILGFPFLSPIQTTHADFLFSLSLPLCLFGKEVREGVDFSTKTRSSGTHDDFPHPFFPLLLFPCVGTWFGGLLAVCFGVLGTACE